MKKVVFLISTIVILFIGCNYQPVSQYTYRQPEQLQDGIAVGSLAAVNLDSSLIELGVRNIQDGRFGEVHSMLIYKDGKLVLDAYFQGHKYQWGAPDHYGAWVPWNATMPHTVHSVSKSITSLCIGIAIDKGFIKSVDQSIFDYLPDHQQFNTEGKQAITIEHLLTMTSGLQWAEWNAPLSSVENDQVGIYFADTDPVNFILDRPLVFTPGTHFNYSGGNIQLLRAILENAAQMPLDSFSQKYLFEPLHADSSYWSLRFRTGEIMAASGLNQTPREMVKIGTVMLNKGIWNGVRIISENWVEKSGQSFAGISGIKVPGEDFGRVGYSYTWWTKEFSNSGRKIKMYWANGWGGQKIMVFPELNMVIVFTGANYMSKVKELKILEKYVLPALR